MKQRSVQSQRARVPPSRERGQLLQYKVVELSTVDEHSLEQTVNRWVSQGWNFDGVQFAMRESSKRPSMGFVFFTRDDAPPQMTAADENGDAEAQARLRRLASDDVPAFVDAEADTEAAPGVLPQVGDRRDERTWPEPKGGRASDPWLRLQQLAADDDDEDEDGWTGPRPSR